MEWDTNHSRVMKSLTNHITIASEWLKIHLRDFHTEVQHLHNYSFHFDPSKKTLIKFRPWREPVVHKAGPTQQVWVTLFEVDYNPLPTPRPNLVPVDSHIGSKHNRMTNQILPRNPPLTGTMVPPQRISEGYGGKLSGLKQTKQSYSTYQYGRRTGWLWYLMDRSWKAMGWQVGT